MIDSFQAVILAAVQGLTEFLPISSSAHLILVPIFLGWPDQGLAFDVAVHVGTLLAVIVFLKQDIVRLMSAWFRGWRTLEWEGEGMLAWWVVIATIPIGLVGLVLGDWVEANLRGALVIAISTLVFGLLLGWADTKADRNQGDLSKLSLLQVLGVGCAQVLALIPGTSRSGVTMTAMLAMGYSRQASVRLSFMLAIPAIALPGLLKTVELVESGSSAQWAVLLLGVAVSAIVALVCMRVFMRLVERIGMLPFVIYRILLAALILVLVW
ncbi:MAG: undecaprenyl-diphosphate phosphatase [Pseudomonadota bacterium]